MIGHPTSEEIYGVIEQPPPSCPIIDSLIIDIKKIRKCVKNCEKEDDVAVLLAEVDDIRFLIQDFMERLEEIRELNTDIRAWGEEWKQIAKKHLPE